jgi:hypothetical protein
LQQPAHQHGRTAPGFIIPGVVGVRRKSGKGHPRSAKREA